MWCWWDEWVSKLVFSNTQLLLWTSISPQTQHCSLDTFLLKIYSHHLVSLRQLFPTKFCVTCAYQKNSFIDSSLGFIDSVSGLLADSEVCFAFWSTETGLASNSGFSCLSILSSGIPGVYRHTRLWLNYQDREWVKCKSIVTELY